MSIQLSPIEVKTIYFNPDAIILPSYNVGRIPFNIGRGYFIAHENHVEFFTSLTTAISTTQPLAREILSWQMSLGEAEYKRQLRVKADYGTIMHQLIGKFCIDKKLAMADIDIEVAKYREQGYNDPEIDKWGKELRKDLRAWAQFCNDVNLEVLCVEVVLVSRKHGYATAIDIIANHDEEIMVDSGEVYKSGARQGEVKMVKGSKRSLCLINMKSGRKGFYDTHAIQLEAEKRIFEENFPDMPVAKIYNWSPTEWRAKPDYKLKDQTGLTNPDELDAMFHLASFRLEKNTKDVVIDEGEIIWGGDVMLGMKSVTMEQYILDYYNQNEDMSTEDGIDLTEI